MHLLCNHISNWFLLFAMHLNLWSGYCYGYIINNEKNLMFLCFWLCYVGSSFFFRLEEFLFTFTLQNYGNWTCLHMEISCYSWIKMNALWGIAVLNAPIFCCHFSTRLISRLIVFLAFQYFIYICFLCYHKFINYFYYQFLFLCNVPTLNMHKLF